MDKGVVKDDSQFSGLGDWVGGSATHQDWQCWWRGGGRGLKEVVSCLALDMLSLRYLWDIQVVIFNREVENRTKAVGNLD